MDQFVLGLRVEHRPNVEHGGSLGLLELGIAGAQDPDRLEAEGWWRIAVLLVPIALCLGRMNRAFSA